MRDDFGLLMMRPTPTHIYIYIFIYTIDIKVDLLKFGKRVRTANEHSIAKLKQTNDFTMLFIVFMVNAILKFVMIRNFMFDHNAVL